MTRVLQSSSIECMARSDDGFVQLCRKRAADEDLETPRYKVAKTSVQAFLKVASDEMKGCKSLVAYTHCRLCKNANSTDQLPKKGY